MVSAAASSAIYFKARNRVSGRASSSIAIAAVRERNIRQVNPESGAGTGFFGPEGGVF